MRRKQTKLDFESLSVKLTELQPVPHAQDVATGSISAPRFFFWHSSDESATTLCFALFTNSIWSRGHVAHGEHGPVHQSQLNGNDSRVLRHAPWDRRQMSC